MLIYDGSSNFGTPEYVLSITNINVAETFSIPQNSNIIPPYHYTMITERVKNNHGNISSLNKKLNIISFAGPTVEILTDANSNGMITP